MSATTDPPHRCAVSSPGHGRLRAVVQLRAVALFATFLFAGCAEEPLPQRPLSREDCLHTVKLEDLPGALARCDKVVAAFPKDPGPLNERFLLHTLAGDTVAACRDIAKATALAARIPRDKLDPILLQDLEIRQKSCRDDEPPAAPAAAPSAGAGPQKPPAEAAN